MDAKRFTQLIHSLKRLPAETEWIEFKENNSDPNAIGEYISALSNSAALFQQPYGYLVWGIEDENHNVVGTKFKPKLAKTRKQDLENLLSNHSHPSIDFRFYEGDFKNEPVVVLEVPAAQHTPVRFIDSEFIRVNSAKRKLKDFPEKERALWKLFREHRFEREIAKENVSADEVLKLLDYPKYFDSLDRTLPANRDAIIEKLKDERMTNASLRERFNIANHNYSTASRIINETIKATLVKVFDTTVSRNQISYVPIWT